MMMIALLALAFAPTPRTQAKALRPQLRPLMISAAETSQTAIAREIRQMRHWPSKAARLLSFRLCRGHSSFDSLPACAYLAWPAPT